ncbi:MAG: phage capsid protein [Paracoccaceae bacterium]|nr:hypothetical protein [Paracoccaceae bacterium]MCB2132359.1 hypothetical protein [Paracoccaceae bacterium]MCB2138088.1 hypothetical protein [Paracoccaceae bacterium]MCB2159946.1 hypothetical protein [Paracoccaceae bacterium]
MSLYPNVEAHHRLQYAAGVTMVAQQKRNPLMGAVTEVPASGEAQSVADLLGQIEYLYGEERSRRNPENPAMSSRRWVVRPPVIESGQYIDRVDKFDTATDPTGAFIVNHTTAVTRGWADRILGIRKNGTNFEVTDGGILGYAVEGKRGTTQTALPAGQYVAHGSAGMTLTKLRAAKLILEKADWGLEDDDQLYGILTPQQKDDLIAIAAATGTALNQFELEQIRTGKPTTLLGINWIFTNRLPKDANGHRMCPIFSKKNIVVGRWQGIEGDMWNDTSAKNMPYVYVSAYLDCVRAQDTGVVVIPCVEP